MKKNNFAAYKYFLYSALVIGCAIILSACGDEQQDQEPGQALASVDGEEITILQLNDELNRAKIQPEQIENAKKQLLESIIDRQLMKSEAQRNKLDRTPHVMQAISRAKTQIIAQAYLQNIASEIENPTPVEVNEFYQGHPEFFSQRKKYNLSIVRFAKNEYNDELKSAFSAAKSLNDVTKWLDKHNIPYLHEEITRDTSQMPREMSARLQQQKKDDMFHISENEDILLVSINAIEAQPISADLAKARIEMYLLNKKRRETAEAAIARLRSSAEIEYLHDTTDITEKTAPQPAVQLTNETDNNPLEDMLQTESIERGISGLK